MRPLARDFTLATLVNVFAAGADANPIIIERRRLKSAAAAAAAATANALRFAGPIARTDRCCSSRLGVVQKCSSILDYADAFKFALRSCLPGAARRLPGLCACI